MPSGDLDIFIGRLLRIKTMHTGCTLRSSALGEFERVVPQRNRPDAATAGLESWAIGMCSPGMLHVDQAARLQGKLIHLAPPTRKASERGHSASRRRRRRGGAQWQRLRSQLPATHRRRLGLRGPLQREPLDMTRYEIIDHPPRDVPTDIVGTCAAVRRSWSHTSAVGATGLVIYVGSGTATLALPPNGKRMMVTLEGLSSSIREFLPWALG